MKKKIHVLQGNFEMKYFGENLNIMAIFFSLIIALHSKEIFGTIRIQG